MSNYWSTLVQLPDTLMISRRLRFSDRLKAFYTGFFGIPGGSKILEIGCGPGALCESLRRWYPDCDITGLDLDEDFISYAKSRVPGVNFIVGNAEKLPFPNHSFDVTISNTVAEHIDHGSFFGEQLRVLRPGGVCIVLSTRGSTHLPAPCIAEESDFERDIWRRVERHFLETKDNFGIGKFAMNEQELPQIMEKMGLMNIETGYISIDLTPDCTDPETASEIIESWRANDIDAVKMLRNLAGDEVGEGEIARLIGLTEEKYRRRLGLLGRERQWDCEVVQMMAARGTARG